MNKYLGTGIQGLITLGLPEAAWCFTFLPQGFSQPLVQPNSQVPASPNRQTQSVNSKSKGEFNEAFAGSKRESFFFRFFFPLSGCSLPVSSNSTQHCPFQVAPVPWPSFPEAPTHHHHSRHYCVLTQHGKFTPFGFFKSHSCMLPCLAK